VPSLPPAKTAAKWAAAWVASNLAWTLVIGAAGALVSALLKGLDVLDNVYALVGVGLLAAAGVAKLPALIARSRKVSLTGVQSFAERFPGIHRTVQQLPAIAETADALLRASEPPPPEPEPPTSIMEAAEAPQPVFPPAPAAAAGKAEQHIETRREAARTTGAQSEHQRDQEAGIPPSDRGDRVGRREAQGRELLLRLAELRARATMLHFSTEPATAFNDLLAESERWAGSSRGAPRAVSTTPTGGRLTLPPDWFSDADFARLKAYLEEHMRRLRRLQG
jgi:hypothetical protein